MRCGFRCLLEALILVTLNFWPTLRMLSIYFGRPLKLQGTAVVVQPRAGLLREWPGYHSCHVCTLGTWSLFQAPALLLSLVLLGSWSLGNSP